MRWDVVEQNLQHATSAIEYVLSSALQSRGISFCLEILCQTSVVSRVETIQEEEIFQWDGLIEKEINSDIPHAPVPGILHSSERV